MPTTKRPRLRRLLIVLAVLYMLGTILGGIGLGWVALHPPSHPITANEERNVRTAAQKDSVVFQDVELKASDHAVLRAWFMRPYDSNGNVVILLHGVSDNRLGMYGYGKWLLANHYSVLLPDARGHGLSTGLATYGLREADDIHRWIDWIETTEHPHCVLGLGESMGAAQLSSPYRMKTGFVWLWPNLRSLRSAKSPMLVSDANFTPGPGWDGPSFIQPSMLDFYMFGFAMD